MKIKAACIVASLALAVIPHGWSQAPNRSGGYGKSREQAAPVARGKTVNGTGKTPALARAQAESRLNGYSNVQITNVSNIGNTQTTFNARFHLSPIESGAGIMINFGSLPSGESKGGVETKAIIVALR